MKLESKANCPLDGFNPCRQLDCAWFMKVRGNNPNTGEEIDDYGCSMAWIPINKSEALKSDGWTNEHYHL